MQKNGGKNEFTEEKKRVTDEVKTYAELGCMFGY